MDFADRKFVAVPQVGFPFFFFLLQKIINIALHVEKNRSARKRLRPGWKGGGVSAFCPAFGIRFGFSKKNRDGCRPIGCTLLIYLGL